MFIELLCLAKILKSSYFKHSLNYQAVLDIKIFLIYLAQGVIHMIETRAGESGPRKNYRGRIFERKSTIE